MMKRDHMPRLNIKRRDFYTRRIIGVIVLIMLQFVISSFASAQTPEITNGLAYLTSTQNPDGSWGDEETSTDIPPATVSVIETLQVLDETGTINYSNATAWFQEQSIETTEYLSERIHALPIFKE